MNEAIRRILPGVAAALALTSSGGLGAASPPTPTKPNIVFVLVDDMGWKDLGCYGARMYETPNIDRLCADGLKFTQAYTPVSICSPTRASIMTGRHPLKLGMWSATHHIKKRDSAILPGFLKPAGYQTWHVGKWHFGSAADHTLPTDLGFDVNIGGWHTWATGGDFWPYNERFKEERFKGNPNIGLPPDFIKRGKPGDYLTDKLTDEAIGLIEHRDVGKPFFLNFWHYAVHEPHQGRPELVEKYRKKIAAAGLHPTYRIDPKTGSKRITSETDPEYAALIESVDRSVGRLVETLKKAGQYDNTLFIFASDNGPTTTCAPLSGGKNTNYEGGIRGPAIAVWPGHIKPGSTYDKAVYLPDVFDTILAAAHVSKPANYDGDGTSWIPIFAGGTLPPRKFFWYFPVNRLNMGAFAGAAFYDEATGMKYVLNFATFGDELFDLRNDLSEERNLLKQQPETAAKMNHELCDFLRKYYLRQPPPPGDPAIRKRLGLQQDSSRLNRPKSPKARP
jgi:arylsulfatase A-like enzyme